MRASVTDSCADGAGLCCTGSVGGQPVWTCSRGHLAASAVSLFSFSGDDALNNIALVPVSAESLAVRLAPRCRLPEMWWGSCA